MIPRRWVPLLTMLALAVPLLFALRWLAREFPQWQQSSTATWVGERYVRWSRVAAEVASKVMIDEGDSLLDLQSGQVYRLRPPEPFRLTNMWYPFESRNEVTADGRVVWSNTEMGGGVGSHLLRVTDPDSHKTKSFRVDPNDILVGGRYVLGRLPRTHFQILDVQETQPVPRNYPAFTPHLIVCSIPSHTNFYCVHSARAPTGMALPNYERAPWLKELEKLDASLPSTTTRNAEIGMLILCHMTNEGPQEIAHWPVYLQYGNSTNVRADGPYIFCRSLDDRGVNVHDANTGQILASIDFPSDYIENHSASNAASVDWSPWQASRFAVSFEETPTAFDPATGRPLPFELGTKSILDRQGNHYLTVNQPPTRQSKSSPLSLQVWNATTGELLATHIHPDPPNIGHVQTIDELTKAMRLTPDGQQIVIGTQRERVLFLDALSGKVIKTVAVSPWQYTGIVLVLLLTVAWIVGWYRACTQSQSPPVLFAMGITLIVGSFLVMRCQLDGQAPYPGRLATQGILAILLVWNVEFVQYLIRPGTSIVMRLTFVILFALVLFLSHYFFFEQSSAEIIFLFWATVNITLAIIFIVLRARGKLLPPRGSTVSNVKLSIKDILLLTTFMALLASTSSATNWMAVFDIPEFLLYAVSFVGLALTVVLFRAWLVLRTIGLVAALLVVLWITQQKAPHETLWMASSLIGCVALASYVPMSERAAMAVENLTS